MSYIQELDTDIRITKRDIIDKINEIISAVNNLNQQIDGVRYDLRSHIYPDSWMDE